MIIILIIGIVLIIMLIYNLSSMNEYFKNKIIVEDIKTNVIIVDKNNFNKYKKDLDILYSKCIYSNNTPVNDFRLNNNKSKVFLLITNNKIIGSLQIDDFDNFNKEYYVKQIGAIDDKKGLFLTYLCGNDDYKGIAKPLFDEVEKYAKNNKYEYILLEALSDWRINYYKKFGYNNINKSSMIKYIF